MINIPELYPDPVYLSTLLYSSNIETNDYIGDYDSYLSAIFDVVKINNSLAESTIEHLMGYAMRDPIYAFFLLTSRFLWSNYNYFNKYINILVNTTILAVNNQYFHDFRANDAVSRNNRLNNILLTHAKLYFPSNEQIPIQYAISNTDIILNKIFNIFKSDTITVQSDADLQESFESQLIESLNYEIPLPDYEYDTDDDSLYAMISDLFIIIFNSLYNLLKSNKNMTPSFVALVQLIHINIIRDLNTIYAKWNLKNNQNLYDFIIYANFLDMNTLRPVYTYVLEGTIPGYHNLPDSEQLYLEFIIHLCYIILLNLGAEITTIIDLTDSNMYTKHIQNFVKLIKQSMGVF